MNKYTVILAQVSYAEVEVAAWTSETASDIAQVAGDEGMVEFSPGPIQPIDVLRKEDDD